MLVYRSAIPMLKKHQHLRETCSGKESPAYKRSASYHTVDINTLKHGVAPFWRCLPNLGRLIFPTDVFPAALHEIYPGLFARGVPARHVSSDLPSLAK